LTEALETEDSSFIASALGTVARALDGNTIPNSIPLSGYSEQWE